MAAIASTASQVAVVYPADAEIFDAIAGVDITASQAVYWNSAGKLVLSNAGASGTAKFAGVALKTVKANQALSVCKRGHIAGFAISALAYAAKVYLSDTAGALDTAAGTVSVISGVVVPLPDAALTKCLFIDANWLSL